MYGFRELLTWRISAGFVVLGALGEEPFYHNGHEELHKERNAKPTFEAKR